MALESGEFHDWELLQNSSDSNSLKSSESLTNLSDLATSEPHAAIQPDYFSLDNCFVASGESEKGSVCSDNPSWVDPESEPRLVERGRGEMWPDSGTDRSEDCNFDEIEAESKVGFVGNGKIFVGFEGIREIESKSELGFVGNGKSFVGFEGIGEIESKSEVGFVGNGEKIVGFERIGEIGSKSELGFVGNGKSFVGFKGIGEIHSSLENSEIGQNSVLGEEISAGENDGFVSKTESDEPMEVAKAGGERGKRGVVWWRVPLELLKFCAFRVSPVWSFSMAAAVMGVVILTRRLYKLKKKSQALKFKVTMDDKKVSQFMSRAARLNEAFSVVRRVPLIRPAMPTTGGLTQWPVMSLR